MRLGTEVQDPLWRLPLWRGYEDTLASRVADLNNNPAYNYAGAITAALFLNRFVEKAQSLGASGHSRLDRPPQAGPAHRRRSQRRARALCAVERTLWPANEDAVASASVTPARPDLAAAHLKGKVDAPRFVEGEKSAVGRRPCHACARGHRTMRRRTANCCSAKFSPSMTARMAGPGARRERSLCRLCARRAR